MKIIVERPYIELKFYCSPFLSAVEAEKREKTLKNEINKYFFKTYEFKVTT